MKYLDCTLRDGGYYTNWDFHEGLVKSYLEAMERLPVEIIEVGYRCLSNSEYTGEYYHIPGYRLEQIRSLAPSKEIAIMLNEAETEIADLKTCIDPICSQVDLVRLAVKPDRFVSSLNLAREIRDRGLKVAFNLMYLSKIQLDDEFIDTLAKLDGQVDYFNLVDSYGGVFPSDIQRVLSVLRPVFGATKIGFHGHNNLEMAFANSLTAIEFGCEIVDGTVCGMGRGAGNLKTEMWMAYVASRDEVDIDFNALSNVVDIFDALRKKFEWGTRLAYMVSGLGSLPQKEVMEWVANRSYSLNSIVQALNNQKTGTVDNQRYPLFVDEGGANTALIIGGGPSVRLHISAIKEFIRKHGSDILLVHASATNAMLFQELDVMQYFCLVGNEGHRLERVLKQFDRINGKCVLPPFPRKMGTYVPERVQPFTFELSNVDFAVEYQDSHTALAIQTVLDLGCGQLWVAGYDGYSGSIAVKEQELYQENEYLFSQLKQSEAQHTPVAITPTRYRSLESKSLYGWLMEAGQ